MLALTFFSNSIMNYSLPEVAASTRIRGKSSRRSGARAVAANMTYDVSIDETRVIQSVAVKAGDT